MPKEIYSLSDATRDTLEDNVKPMCDGWNKSKTHVYNILDETVQDPFPPFLSMYNGALRGGLSTIHWDTELNLAQARNKKQRPEPTAAKLNKEAFDVIDAILEGKPSDTQRKEILELIEVLNTKVEAIDRLEQRNGLSIA